MPLFDKLKNASRKIAEQSSSKAKDLWQEYGDTITSKALDILNETAALGKPYIVDDKKFKEKVNDRLWKLVPLPVRLLGRERLKWDSILFGIRNHAFLIDGENVQLRPDAKEKLVQSLKAVLNQSSPSDKPAEEDKGN